MNPLAIGLSSLLLTGPLLASLLYPRRSDSSATLEFWKGNTSLMLVGAVVFGFYAMAYALMDDEDLQARKKRYRCKRDAFRNDPELWEELQQWRRKNNDCDYKKLGSGMIPASMINKSLDGMEPFHKSDTWFTEFELHNKPSMILSEAQDSYIIGNLATYDKRQYPQWYDAKFEPGVNTPEGQGFGHTLVISKTRIFNVVDPVATWDGCRRLKDMKHHFISFWETENGSSKLIRRTQSAFDDQNAKLERKQSNLDTFQKLLPTLKKDFDSLAEEFKQLKPKDFQFAFHAWPDNSVGHLHMHVYPKKEELRKFSAKRHDVKTIPLEAILQVQEEDRRRLAEVNDR
ncbi:hypothetical protein N7G274_006231 [Stereocaulon virgatum]|uniref:Uncharacterized protein n=1 Tax=Stereocaulon virgatum TaxID=373712 RepID=A0ABR4A6U4_9LECA